MREAENLFRAPFYLSGPHPFLKYRFGRTEVYLPPQKVRFLRLTHLGRSRHPWSVGELLLYTAGAQGAPAGWDKSARNLKKLVRKQGWKYVLADAWPSAMLRRDLGDAVRVVIPNLGQNDFGHQAKTLPLKPALKAAPENALVVGRREAVRADEILKRAGVPSKRMDAGRFAVFALDKRIRPAALAPVAVTSNRDRENAARLARGRPASGRWGSQKPQEPGIHLTADLGRSQEIGGFRLACSPIIPGTIPRGLKVLVSDDGLAWSLAPHRLAWPLYFSGQLPLARPGADNQYALDMPVKARFIRLELTQSHPVWWWSVERLEILAPLKRGPMISIAQKESRGWPLLLAILALGLGSALVLIHNPWFAAAQYEEANPGPHRLGSHEGKFLPHLLGRHLRRHPSRLCHRRILQAPGPPPCWCSGCPTGSGGRSSSCFSTCWAGTCSTAAPGFWPRFLWRCRRPPGPISASWAGTGYVATVPLGTRAFLAYPPLLPAGAFRPVVRVLGFHFRRAHGGLSSGSTWLGAPYLAAAFLAAFLARPGRFIKRDAWLILAGLALGAAPFIHFNLVHDFPHLDVGETGRGVGLLGAVLVLFKTLIPQLLGAVPVYLQGGDLAGPALWASFGLSLLLMAYFCRYWLPSLLFLPPLAGKPKAGIWMLVVFMAAAAGAWFVSPRAGDIRPRYLHILSTALPLLTACAVWRAADFLGRGKKYHWAHRRRFGLRGAGYTRPEHGRFLAG